MVQCQTEELERIKKITHYEVWLWSSRNDFIANVSVYLQLTDRDHPWSTQLEQLRT